MTSEAGEYPEHEKLRAVQPMSHGNVPRRASHSQVCVWPGTVVGPGKVADFESFMRTDLGARVQYLEEITTGPGKGGPGGRTDVFFAVHEDDVVRFAIARLRLGVMSWVEDAIADINGGCVLYPDRVRAYCTWDAGGDEDA